MYKVMGAKSTQYYDFIYMFVEQMVVVGIEL